MLLDRAKEFVGLVSQYSRLSGNADIAAAYATRAEQLAHGAGRLRPTRNKLEALRNAGVPLTFNPQQASALAEKAHSLRTAIQKDPKVLEDPPFDLKYEFNVRLSGLDQAANETMLRDWQAFVRSAADSHPDDVLNALAAIPQFRRTVDKIRQCKVEIGALASAIPSDPTACIAKLEVLVEQQRTAWTQIAAGDIPREVARFLNDCAAAGAPLTALTDDVRSWLVDRNILSAFRIRI